MSSEKVKIYVDTGADISFLKSYYDVILFLTFPYDSEHRRQKPPKLNLAVPSAARLNDCHVPWDDCHHTWDDFEGSPIHPCITEIIGATNRRDVLHVDSAHKEGVDIFLTSDKKDIWQHRSRLEPVVGFKIFHTPPENTIIEEAVRQAVQSQTLIS